MINWLLERRRLGLIPLTIGVIIAVMGEPLAGALLCLGYEVGVALGRRYQQQEEE